MVKSRANISLDPNTHEQAKSVYDNLSERVNELIEQDLDVSKLEDEEMIQDKIEELENKRNRLQAEMDELQTELDQVESELSAAEASLERLRREEAEEQEDLEWAIKKIKRADYSDKSLRYCSNELDMSQDELEEKARKSDIEPEKQVKQV